MIRYTLMLYRMEIYMIDITLGVINASGMMRQSLWPRLERRLMSMIVCATKEGLCLISEELSGEALVRKKVPGIYDLGSEKRARWISPKVLMDIQKFQKII
jgi:hypothetical protein